MLKVGIPRALLYYQYYPMWHTFFRELGVEPVVSPPTTQAMLDAGSARVVADTCLPVKIFLGHVLHLMEKCDCLFIPAVRSVKPKVYNCSKFLGLPDMTRAVIPESPQILEIEIDVNQGKRHLYQAIYRLGRSFSMNPLKIRRASRTAWQTHLSYQQLMSRKGLTPLPAIARQFDAPESKSDIPLSHPDATRGTIAVIGHPYLIYDEHVTHRLICRLEKANYRVLTPELLTIEARENAIVNLTGNAYWTYEDEVVGAGGHYLENNADGVIGIMAFGCGPDSVMMDIVRRHAAKLRRTPFMSLTLEEHTAETGVITRLEAFLDMIHRKKQKVVSACA